MNILTISDSLCVKLFPLDPPPPFFFYFFFKNKSEGGEFLHESSTLFSFHFWRRFSWNVKFLTDTHFVQPCFNDRVPLSRPPLLPAERLAIVLIIPLWSVSFVLFAASQTLSLFCWQPFNYGVPGCGFFGLGVWGSPCPFLGKCASLNWVLLNFPVCEYFSATNLGISSNIFFCPNLSTWNTD